MYARRKLADSSPRKKMLVSLAVVILLVLLAAITLSVIGFSGMNKVENAGVDTIDTMAYENGYQHMGDNQSYPMHHVQDEEYLDESTSESIYQDEITESSPGAPTFSPIIGTASIVEITEPSPRAPTFSPIIGTASIVEGENDSQDSFGVGSSAPCPSESANFIEEGDSATPSPTISTQDPTRQPSRHFVLRPSWRPTPRPTALTPVPSLEPSGKPFTEPSSEPSGLPTQKQTLSPSQSNPTVEPTVDASPRPSPSPETISPDIYSWHYSPDIHSRHNHHDAYP